MTWPAVSKITWRSPCKHHEAKRVVRERGLICFHLFNIGGPKRIRMGVYQTLRQATLDGDTCCQKARCYRMQPIVEWTQVDKNHYAGGDYIVERRPRARRMVSWALLLEGILIRYYETRAGAQAEVECLVRAA